MLTEGTKAEVLANLAERVHTATVLPQIRFTRSEWRTGKLLLKLRQQGWHKRPVIVRSSAIAEDGEQTSLAGHFTSQLDVLGETALSAAIDSVAESLQQDSDQIFIQPMLQNIQLSGVAFSQDPNTGSPYYIINYDDHSGRTDTVTAGSSNVVKTYYCVKGAKTDTPDTLLPVIALLAELEHLYQHSALDIEFAIDRDHTLYLLQVRPLIIRAPAVIDNHTLHAALEDIADKFKQINTRHPYLCGERTVMGVMPDWNPAEIIGTRPRPLALSLYRELITDMIWAYQRDNYGYRNLRSFPLMFDFHGLPYIDTRVSFNSFIPKTLPTDIANQLVNYYTEQLMANPALHDKVEFKIILSCYTLDLDERLAQLSKHGFSDAQQQTIKHSLLTLTNNIIGNQQGLWLKDLGKIDTLAQRRKQILDAPLTPIAKIYWLLEDCKRYGTLPFAGLARAGFIAVQLLQSLRRVGVLDQADYHAFMASVDSVSSQMQQDLASIDRPAFLAKYGHLRPGTYDILSPRYDESPDTYFPEQQSEATQHAQVPHFKLTLPQLKKIETLLTQHGFEHDVLSFFEFIQRGIEGRELAKFVFTNSLSDAMQLFADYCETLGIDKQDCSFANISVINQLYHSSYAAEDTVKQSVSYGKTKYQLTQQITLPPLITDETDIWRFHLPQFEPNFITLGCTEGRVTTPDDDIEGSIVFIPSADPGYDWIFTRNIAGFITQYGGANSHMAIRASELNLPAVVGAGDTLFNRWQSAHYLKLDCNNKQVQVIR